MNTEDYLRAHAAAHPDDNWIGSSDFYQQLLEECGETGLRELIPHLLDHPDHDAQCCGLILAGTRRPESTEAMLLIAPFMTSDAHPLARLTAFHQLLSFSWVDPEVESIAFRISQEEFSAKDPTACVMAMKILLKANVSKYGNEMLTALQIVHDFEAHDTMVKDLAREALNQWGQ